MQTLVDLEFYLADFFEVDLMTYHGIELINGKKSRVYFFESADERDLWAEAF